MPFAVNTDRPSHLVPDQLGHLKVRLVQSLAGWPLAISRLDFEGAQGPFSSTHGDAESCRALLKRTLPDALNVVSFHRAMPACVKELEALSQNRTIVTLAGIDEADVASGKNTTNNTFLATDGEVEKLPKLSLASEDQRSNVQRGNRLRVFLPQD